MISYSIDASGLDAKLFSAVENFSMDEAVDEASAILLNRIRTRFLAEEGPDGRWTPSKAGIKRKAGGYTYRNGRKYTGTGTLFETGTLFHSIQLYRIGVGERAIRTDVPYAKYQQNGNTPRVFLGFNEDDISIATGLVLRRVKDALNG